MKRRTYLAAAGAVALMLSVGTAMADLVTVEVTGTVEYVNDPNNALTGEIQTSQQVTGTYTYDTSVADIEPSPEYGRYPQDPAQLALRLDIGSLVFATNDTPSPTAFAAVDVMNSYGDGFHVGAASNFQPLANGASVEYVDFDFFDPSGVALDSDAMLTTAPELAKFSEPLVYVSGNGANGAWYDFRVRITSATVAGGTGTGPEGTYNVSAEIVDIYDPSGVLGTSLSVGSAISGTYFIDTSVPDQRPDDPQWGIYEQPVAPGFGFSLEAGGISFVSDSTLPGRPVLVEVRNAYADEFHILTSGQTTPTTNGNLNVDYIDMWLASSSDQLWSSDALPVEAPPVASFDRYRDLVLGGTGPNGEYWHVIARVTSITKAAATVEGPQLVSPPTGFYFRDQEVRVAFRLPAGKHFSHVTGTMNGQPVGSFEGSCHPIPLRDPGREAALCGDLNYLLPGGSHNLTWTVHYMDGTSDTESVEWEMIE